MRLQYPFQYEIFGTTSSNRRPKRRYFEEIIEVDIQEIESGVAPVAITWRPGHYPGSRTTIRCGNVSGPDGMQMTRWYDGWHWQRLCDGHFYGTKKGGALTTRSYLQAMLDDPQRQRLISTGTRFPQFLDSSLQQRMKRVDHDARQDFETIRLDGRQIAMGYVENALSNLIAVDGVVYRRCLEPYVCVKLDHTSAGLKCVDLAVEATAESIWGASTGTFAYFALRDWAAATDFALEHGFEPEGGIAIDPDILIEESLIDDWNMYYQAGAEITALISSLSLFSGRQEPLLERARICQDPDEQYEMMLAFDPDDVRWADNDSARRSYGKIMDILSNRAITLALPTGRPKIT